MAQYIEFATNHPIMLGLFLLILVLLAAGEWRRNAAGAKRVSPLLATGVINADGSTVVDVRPSGEFKSGHITGARNISFTELSEKAEKLDADKQKPLLVCCKNGMHAPDAARQFKQLGYEQVYVLAGGIAAWTADNMPLEK